MSRIPIPFDLGRIAGKRDWTWRDMAAAIVRKLGSESWKLRMRWRRRFPSSLAVRLVGAQHVLFVCTGNIMRSPYAASFLRQQFPDCSRRTIRSAGLLPLAGRPAHDCAMKQAKKRGMDLSGHRSVSVGARDVEEADLIVAMEGVHLAMLRSRFRVDPQKLLLLGCCAPTTPVEIRDPYVADERASEEIFRQLDEAIIGMGRIMFRKT